MALDLQKLAIRRLLESQNTDFYANLTNKFFSGPNLELLMKVQSFYKANLRIPSIEEFKALNKSLALQDYFINQIASEENKSDKVRDEFLIAQLQDFAIREETISFLESFLNDLEDLEKSEIIDRFQNHLLELNKSSSNSDEIFNVVDLSIIPETNDFRLFPSGLNHMYDSINGGFGLQELVLLGGRKGAGKSIISLNCALERYRLGYTAIFFSIEMSYIETYNRLMSIISGVSAMDIYKNTTNINQKLQMTRAKLDWFYNKSEELDYLYTKLEKSNDFKQFDIDLKNNTSIKRKENNFIIIDKNDLTLSKIDHYLNLFSSKCANLSMAVIDYINIIKADDNKNWITQINFAETLKLFSRKYNITVLSPYQVSSELEARFAKGLLDSADRGLVFLPKESNENLNENLLKTYTSKIRNGKQITFDIAMDWDCLRIDTSKGLEHKDEKLRSNVLYSSEKSPDEKSTDLI